MPAEIDLTEELTEAICGLIMDGLSMRQIAERADMPSRSTMLRWLAANEAFEARCARARLFQADLMDDKVLETADACTPETAAADRVKISAYQWRASKLAPKKYGERTVIAGDEDAPLQASVKVEFVKAKGE